MFADDRYNSWSRFAIPQRRTLRLAYGFPEEGSSSRENAIRIHSDYLIRAVLNRRRPFRILTQRKARHAENSGFLLYSAEVCEDNTCPVVERKEIEISEQIKRHDSNAVSPYHRVLTAAWDIMLGRLPLQRQQVTHSCNPALELDLGTILIVDETRQQ